MSESIITPPLAAPARFLLLHEEARHATTVPDSPRPRVRRYHLSRVGGKAARPGVNPGPRPVGDCSHLRHPHD